MNTQRPNNAARNNIARYAAWIIVTAIGTGIANAGMASTSASAGNANGGSANATAEYAGGDQGKGFAHTETETGSLNRARGVALGWDRETINLSLSHAIATKLGVAYAGTLNISIGRDGQVTSSYGNAIATGGKDRSAEAGGSTAITRGQPTSSANASGYASHDGKVKAETQTYTRPARQIQARQMSAQQTSARGATMTRYTRMPQNLRR